MCMCVCVCGSVCLCVCVLKLEAIVRDLLKYHTIPAPAQYCLQKSVSVCATMCLCEKKNTEKKTCGFACILLRFHKTGTRRGKSIWIEPEVFCIKQPKVSVNVAIYSNIKITNIIIIITQGPPACSSTIKRLRRKNRKEHRRSSSKSRANTQAQANRRKGAEILRYLSYPVHIVLNHTPHYPLPITQA